VRLTKDCAASKMEVIEESELNEMLIERNKKEENEEKCPIKFFISFFAIFFQSIDSLCFFSQDCYQQISASFILFLSL
jgi:hypothetical protein